MTALGLSHYNLRAPRELLEQLREFYCEVVGLNVGERPAFRSRGHWLYAGDQAVLHLTEASAHEKLAVDVATTFNHAAYRCRGRADYERKLAECGLAYETSRVPSTGEVQLFFSDPAGNGVELIFASDEA